MSPAWLPERPPDPSVTAPGQATSSPAPSKPSKPAPVSQAIVQVVQQIQRFVPSGIVPLRFSIGDIPANIGAKKLYRPIVVSASTVEGAQLSVPIVFPGFVAALTFASDTTKNQGTCSFQAFFSGTGSASIDWESGSEGYAIYPVGKYPFSPGTSMDIRVSSSNLSPTTANVEVTAYLAQTKET